MPRKKISAEQWFHKGVALSDLGRYEEALEAYAKATKINPTFSEAWFNTGATLHNLRRYEEALEAYEKTTRINPNDPQAWLNT